MVGSADTEQLPDRVVAQLASTVRQRPRPSTDSLRNAGNELAGAISRTQDELCNLVAPRAADIGKQVVNAEQLLQKVTRSSLDLEGVENDFDANQPKNIPELSRFLDLTATRQVAQGDSLLAEITLNALRALSWSGDKLRHLEDDIWSGRGADPTVLECLHSFNGTEQDYSNSEIMSRGEQLKSLVSEQLSSAWTQAVVVGMRPAGPFMKVAESIALTPPNVPRGTSSLNVLPTKAQQYSVFELNEALQSLGMFDPLLRQLQSQILRDIIEPIVSSQTLVPDNYAPGDTILLFKENSDLSLTDVVSGVRDVVRFVGSNIHPMPETAGDTPAFLQTFSEAVYLQVLRDIIIPSVPDDLADLPHWLRLVEQCARWEEEGPVGPTGGVLRLFLSQEVSVKWLGGHRAAGLLEARNLVYEGWKGWSARQEETGGQAASPPKPNVDLVDDGWGFDDDLAATTAAPTAVKSSQDAGADGWNFDDDATASTVAQPSPPRLAKPAREAKRLGKKLTSKQPSARTSQEILPEFVSDERPSSQASIRSSEQVQPARAIASSPGPKAHVASSFICVSQAADLTLVLLRRRLQELKQLEELTFSSELREALTIGLQSQLMEILDFLRATLPVAHRQTFISSPAKIVQLGNDFRYLASKLPQCEAEVHWTMRDQATSEYVSAAYITYQTFQVQEQHAIRAIFEGVNRFNDIGEDDVYQHAQEATTDLIHFVTEVADQLKLLVDDDLYHQLLGSLVETVCVLDVDAVLAMEDITEVESQRIEALIKKAEGLQVLFRSDNLGMSSVTTFAPHWLKMCYTSEILRGNLAEITRLFENGSLIDFTPDELSKLIRALFADSQKRAALLERVQQ